MKFGRAWRAKKAIPGVGTEAHDAGERTFEIAKTNGAQKGRKIGAKGEDRGAIFVAGINYDHKKNCRLRERR